MSQPGQLFEDPPWVGWRRCWSAARKRMVWQRVIDGSTFEECQGRMIEAMDTTPEKHTGWMVLPRGEKP